MRPAAGMVSRDSRMNKVWTGGARQVHGIHSSRAAAALLSVSGAGPEVLSPATWFAS